MGLAPRLARGLLRTPVTGAAAPGPGWLGWDPQIPCGRWRPASHLDPVETPDPVRALPPRTPAQRGARAPLWTPRAGGPAPSTPNGRPYRAEQHVLMPDWPPVSGGCKGDHSRLRAAFRILHSAFCILHSALCIPHSAFRILHSKGPAAGVQLAVQLPDLGQGMLAGLDGIAEPHIGVQGQRPWRGRVSGGPAAALLTAGCGAPAPANGNRGPPRTRRGAGRQRPQTGSGVSP
jgi:hypothetical protein